MADLASFEYGRDDEEGEYDMVDMSSDEDDPSGTVSCNETLYNKLCSNFISGFNAGKIFTQYGNIFFFSCYNYL